MKIMDCFMVFNEIDMVLLRMQMLQDVVGAFVVVESSMTHSGQLKPLYFQDAVIRGVFSRIKTPINYVHLEELQGANSWERERFQRRCIGVALDAYADQGDLICVGDADEIPSPEALMAVPPQGARLELDMYYYNLHWRVPQGWSIGALPWGVEKDPNIIRTLEGHDVPTIQNAGWHMSYFSDAEGVIAKLDAFMHHADVAKDVPRDPAWIQDRMDNGLDIYDRNVTLQLVTDEKGWPPAVLAARAVYEAKGWI